MITSSASSRTLDPVRMPASTTPVSVLLRTRTRAAHEATERAFDVEARLTGREKYLDLLVLLRGVHAPLEAALAAVPGWSATFPTLELLRWRVPLLDADLAALGGAPDGEPAPVPELSSPALALGCLYVLAGSTLGGQLVARRARETLGPDLPVAFFTSGGRRGTGREWRCVQVTLDAIPRTLGPLAFEDVLSGAERTFAAMRSWLGAGEHTPTPGVVR